MDKSDICLRVKRIIKEKYNIEPSNEKSSNSRTLIIYETNSEDRLIFSVDSDMDVNAIISDGREVLKSLEIESDEGIYSMVDNLLNLNSPTTK